MTLAMVWVRRIGKNAEELVFASDSRLSAGNRFDQCSKMVTFARGDAAMCFAGGTSWAYPMMTAASRAVEAHHPTRTRALPLPAFRTHLLRVLNQMQKSVHTYSPGENIPDVTFLLGGYDWILKTFRLWRVEYSAPDGEFRAHERRDHNRFGVMGRIELAGDREWIDEARRRLKKLLQSRYGLGMDEPESQRFDMEPFEVLRDLLRESRPTDSIGGSPQVTKVYQHMNTRSQAVFWPDRHGRPHYCGRPALDYENIDVWVLDPDSLVTMDGRLLGYLPEIGDEQDVNHEVDTDEGQSQR